MIDVVIVAVAIVTLAAGLCGHATQPFPLARWWRTLRAWHRRNQASRHALHVLACRRPRRTTSWGRR